MKAIPRHVAIIMDGNRRWARERGLSSEEGHWKGADAITPILEEALHWGVEILTLYSFSTENWTRKASELGTLMEILETYLTEKRGVLIEKGVKLQTIGNIDRMPARVKNALADTMRATEKGKSLILVLALNYGGRDEIRRAVVRIISDQIAPQKISEELFSRYLETAQWPDPDLLIRTSGEYRLSNFLLWQLCYAEMIFVKTLWPDFNREHFAQAIEEYQRRQRRYGE